MNKKGQAIGNLPDTVLAVVVIGFIIAVGLLLLVKLKATNQDSADVNTSVDAVISAINQIPTFLGILVLAIVAGVVIVAVTVLRGRG